MRTNTMTLKRAPAFLRQTGPKVEANTVRVYTGGKTLRISNDLISQLYPGKQCPDYLDLVPFIGQDSKVLVLKLATKEDVDKGTVLRTWQSSPEARSVLISLAGLLPSLGLDEKTLPGTYKAEVEDDSLRINFASKL